MGLLLAFLLSLFSASASPEELAPWAGKVVGVQDGDTLEVMREGKAVRIRLAGIDAPERGQPFGTRARQAAAKLVFGKVVEVRPETLDRYGRIVAEIVLPDGRSLTQMLVALGMAWHYKRYSSDPTLVALEARARRGRAGLWVDAHPVPPWNWRRGDREPKSTASTSAEDFVCGVKRYCREMISCAEARFHLEQCGLTRLDGDSDGVPCEAICK